MKEEFIPYTEALALKELGFDEPCLGLYNEDGLQYDGFEYSFPFNNSITKQGMVDSALVAAPLWQQAFRWFREKYNRPCEIQIFDKGFLEKNKYCYQWRIYDDKEEFFVSFTEWKTYEEAQLTCLQELIKIVKNGKKLQKLGTNTS